MLPMMYIMVRRNMEKSAKAVYNRSTFGNCQTWWETGSTCRIWGHLGAFPELVETCEWRTTGHQEFLQPLVGRSAKARSSADLLSSAKALSRKTATLHMADELLLCIFDSQMDRDWEEAEFECQEPVMALRTTFGAALMARRRLSEAVETPPPPKVAEDWEAEALRWWETAGPDTLA
ncbi:unnamed protein product [Symbiodinium natans]|uniref:Uncharacterized protein n=1 Tax=Symbiodinium natans TaxID=878477 RepID=A0A812JJQ3_9DINO|nr:unnamed protein product [Symbiodinium natans]